jgi:MoxR-like ATPase
MSEKIKEIKKEVQKIIIGQEKMIDALLIGILCDGHILLEGVPGLAKTTTINAIAKTLSLDFKRVQFTPDLLPSDILGTEIYDPKRGEFKIKKGPVFTNLLLTDEINRAPAKVQSALLEVMQEKQVTIGEETFFLSPPFLVMATQNPIEHEGTYLLPEAQLDRFMLKVTVGYNTKEEELKIASMVSKEGIKNIKTVASKDDLQKLKEETRNIFLDEELQKYIVEIVFATRYPEKYSLEELKDYIFYGASPRATIDLFKASKAVAYLKGKEFVTPLEINYIAKDVLRHRIILSYEAEAKEITSDYIIDKILQKVPIP